MLWIATICEKNCNHLVFISRFILLRLQKPNFWAVLFFRCHVENMMELNEFGNRWNWKPIENSGLLNETIHRISNKNCVLICLSRLSKSEITCNPIWILLFEMSVIAIQIRFSFQFSSFVQISCIHSRFFYVWYSILSCVFQFGHQLYFTIRKNHSSIEKKEWKNTTYGIFCTYREFGNGCAWMIPDNSGNFYVNHLRLQFDW